MGPPINGKTAISKDDLGECFYIICWYYFIRFLGLVKLNTVFSVIVLDAEFSIGHIDLSA